MHFRRFHWQRYEYPRRPILRSVQKQQSRKKMSHICIAVKYQN